MKAPFRRKDEPELVEPEEEMSLARYASAAPPVADDVAFNALRTGFTAAVSHELRTPLARILVHLESAELPGADVHKLLEQAREEVHNARELIDDILFLAELESGKEVVALGHTAVLPVLEQVVEAQAASAARAGVRLRAEGDGGLDVPLRPKWLRMIAENLAENAVRYAGHGATFTLSVVREGDTVVLTGSDDGIGLAQADLPRLFERFWRADASRATRGTGLGLALVKRIVVAAGGSVDATGGRGEGLTVRCLFPA